MGLRWVVTFFGGVIIMFYTSWKLVLRYLILLNVYLI